MLKTMTRLPSLKHELVCQEAWPGTSKSKYSSSAPSVLASPVFPCDVKKNLFLFSVADSYTDARQFGSMPILESMQREEMNSRRRFLLESLWNMTRHFYLSCLSNQSAMIATSSGSVSHGCPPPSFTISSAEPPADWIAFVNFCE